MATADADGNGFYFTRDPSETLLTPTQLHRTTALRTQIKAMCDRKFASFVFQKDEIYKFRLMGR